MASQPLGIRAAGAGFTYAGAAAPAVRDLDLELEPGSLLLVVGPSGSGKSTLARGLAGLLPSAYPGAWQGSLRVGDREVAGGAPAAGDEAGAGPAPPAVGIVFQDPASQLVMERAGDDVAFGLENHCWPLPAMRERVPLALAEMGLAGFEARRANRLSGGEQQRLALAGALAPGPGLLILDEPTANLDPFGAAAVFERLGSLRDRRAATVVLVEHRVNEAWALADRVLALDGTGRPLDFGPPVEVLERSGEQMARAGTWLPDGGPRVDERDGRRERGSRTAAERATAIPVVELREARFGFDPGAAVLRGVDLVVRPGERVAVVGPNGSGKTTLLRLVLGLLRPSAGSVRFAGRDPARMPARELAGLAGYVVQDPELGFLGQTVGEELALGLDAAGVERAFALAERLDLPVGRFGDRSPYRLSGGEQRRLSLVTALVRGPRLLVLDEPTYGQDRRGHDALVAALDEHVGQGAAILAATHDERFVRDAARRRVELADGWIVADEPIARAAVGGRPAPGAPAPGAPAPGAPIGRTSVSG